MALNPDFRGADEVVLPENAVDLQGWSVDDSEADALGKEDVMYDKFEADMPVACRTREPVQMNETVLAKWDEFQQSKGRQPGSHDWSLLDEFVHGKPLLWYPQIIGSCVFSNTFRGVVIRMMIQIALHDQAREYLGRNEHGPDNYSPYAPWSYGMARRRANMRGGDGLYCAPMAESMVKDGFLPCSTPALVEFLKGKGLARDKDFPEPQHSGLYREFGRWKYLDDFKQYAGMALVECPRINSAEQLWSMMEQGKPTFVCSGEAIHKVGTHPDGFAIHARNPRDSWAHNMCFHGCFVASDGERFFRESNESWGEKHIYNRRYDEVAGSFQRNRLRCAAIGEMLAPPSRVPTIEV